MNAGRVSASRVGVFSEKVGPASRLCMRCGIEKQTNSRTPARQPFICAECRRGDPVYVRMVLG